MFLVLMSMIGLSCNLPNRSVIEIPSETPVNTPIQDVSNTPSTNGLPDFIVEILSIDNNTIVQSADPWTWIHYRVTNIGTATYPDEVKLIGMENQNPGSGYMIVEGPFAPNQSIDSKFAVGHNSYWLGGDYVYAIIVDYQNLIMELNENNNTSNEITFKVVVP